MHLGINHPDSILQFHCRVLDNREGYILIKGKPEKLLAHLIEERDTSIDPYYVEDFLLVYRTFMASGVVVFDKLIAWFDEPANRDKVARLVLLWVNNHFNDFETDAAMMTLLERFEAMLERENMTNHQSLLNIACSVKSRPRLVTYTRSTRDDVLQFSVLGGVENRTQGIFIAKVDTDSQAERIGLKRGDELLDVNGQNCQAMTHAKVLELLRGGTHLALTVKSNLLGFKEMMTNCQPVDADGTVTAVGEHRRRSSHSHRSRHRIGRRPPSRSAKSRRCSEAPWAHCRSRQPIAACPSISTRTCW